jgi:hypothetical protein
MGLFNFFNRSSEPEVEYYTKADVNKILEAYLAKVDQMIAEAPKGVSYEQVKDMLDQRAAIVDPAPYSNLKQEMLDIVVHVIREESASREFVAEYVKDALKDYDVEEDAEVIKMIDEKLAEVKPVESPSSETIKDTVLHEFKTDMYFKAMTELKAMSSKPNLLAIRAFLVRFVELYKP